jgi:hypothetical protein
MTETIIKNHFTGYRKLILTKGLPKIGTLRKHLRASKAQGCQSVTHIFTEQGVIDVTRFGEVLINGRQLKN